MDNELIRADIIGGGPSAHGSAVFIKIKIILINDHQSLVACGRTKLDVIITTSRIHIHWIAGDEVRV